MRDPKEEEFSYTYMMCLLLIWTFAVEFNPQWALSRPFKKEKSYVFF